MLFRVVFYSCTRREELDKLQHKINGLVHQNGFLMHQLALAQEQQQQFMTFSYPNYLQTQGAGNVGEDGEAGEDGAGDVNQNEKSEKNEGDDKDDGAGDVDEKGKGGDGVDGDTGAKVPDLSSLSATDREKYEDLSKRMLAASDAYEFTTAHELQQLCEQLLKRERTGSADSWTPA